GMTATVDIITEKKEKVISVPIAAVTTRDGSNNEEKKDQQGPPSEDQGANEPAKPKKKELPKEVVFVAGAENKVKMREVKTGITDTAAGTIEIKDGLKEGEEIVSGPFIAVSKKLKDGDLVTKKGEQKDKAKKN
ncbi:MAG TPA: efflux transporter periplasmic adaptor subunit, partial [Emticicia sp.]